MWAMKNLWVFLIYFLCSSLMTPSQSAAPRGAGVEREEDGAYSPRKHGEEDHHFDHEAIIGSAKTAKEFDELSPEEAKSRLRVLLDKMDRNTDSSIDKNELKSWILRSFRSLSKEESDDRFKDSDHDKDGFVSWGEYLKEEFDKSEFDLENGGTGEIEEEEDAEEMAMMKEDKFLFQAADVDADGKLTPDQFLAFTHPEENPSMAPHVVAQVLLDKDKDSDGKLDFKEYVGDRGRDYDKERLKEEKDRFDNDLDGDGNGYLDEKEISDWIVPSNEEIAAEETDHLFAGADDDLDGILSYEEILNHHDLFVGSEATDYGEHLQNIEKFQDEL